MLDNKNKHQFKDIYGYGHPYSLIHPYKQQAAKHIVETKPQWVSHIIIFGSAVGTWHFYEKDLDVCIVGADPQPIEERDYKYQSAMKQDGVKYDFLHFDDLSCLYEHQSDINSVEHDILHEGVVVFEKN